MSQMLAYRGFSLQKTANSTKILITLFLGMTAIATTVGVIMYHVRTGLSAAGGMEYYVAEGEPAHSMLELLDATHPHLFTMAFLVFVLGHIFALTRVTSKTKTRLALMAFGSVLLDAAAPWIITYFWPVFSTVQLLNTAVLSGVILAYLAVPMYEMWLASPATAYVPVSTEETS